MVKEDVVEFLFSIGLSNIQINKTLIPLDLNPTHAIDSFLEAITYIVTNNI